MNSIKIKNILGSVLMLVGMGLKSSLSSLLLYIFSYFRQYDSSVSIEHSTSFISLYTIPAAILALFSLKISSYISLKYFFRIISCIDALSYILAIFQTNFYLFLLFYIYIPNFIAFGLLSVPLIKNIWDFFPNNKGFVTGILFASSGLSQLFYTYISSQVINPNNLKADVVVIESKNIVRYFGSNVNDHFLKLLYFQAFSFAFFVILGAFLIQDYKDDNLEIIVYNNNLNNKLINENNQEIEEEQQEDQKKIITLNDIIEVILSRQFLIFFIIVYLLYCFDSLLIFTIKEILLKNLKDDNLISIILTIYCLINSLGKLILGYLYDKIKLKVLLQGLIISLIITGLLMTSQWGKGIIMILCYLMIGFISGGVQSVEATCLNDLFDKRVAIQLYPVKGFAYHLAVLTVSLSLRGLFIYFTYNQTFIIFVLLLLLPLFLSQFIDYSPNVVDTLK